MLVWACSIFARGVLRRRSSILLGVAVPAQCARDLGQIPTTAIARDDALASFWLARVASWGGWRALQGDSGTGARDVIECNQERVYVGNCCSVGNYLQRL